MSLQAGTAEIELMKAMVLFDQAYIPALALTSVEQVYPSRKAYAQLMRQWREFKQTHENISQNDQRWADDLEAVEVSLRRAGKLIAEGEELKEAHEALEHIRQVMLRARERMGMDYFLDHLTRFHDPMEAIVLKCKNTPPQQLSPSDIEELEHQLRLAQRLWLKVRETEFDAKLFEFDEEREATMRQSMLLVEGAMTNLERALAVGDEKEILTAGQGLKPPFARCFKLFGRFPGESD